MSLKGLPDSCSCLLPLVLSHVFQNQVFTLRATIQAIEGDGAKTDIGQLQSNVKAVTTALKALGSDVINLRSEVHAVTEIVRKRSQKLQVLGTSFHKWNIALVHIK